MSTPREIISATAALYGITPAVLCASHRTKFLVQARWLAIRAIHEMMPDLSLTEIGRELGGRDHSTISHGLARVDFALQSDGPVRQRWLELMRRLGRPQGAEADEIIPLPFVPELPPTPQIQHYRIVIDIRLEPVERT